MIPFALYIFKSITRWENIVQKSTLTILDFNLANQFCTLAEVLVARVPSGLQILQPCLPCSTVCYKVNHMQQVWDTSPEQHKWNSSKYVLSSHSGDHQNIHRLKRKFFPSQPKPPQKFIEQKQIPQCSQASSGVSINTDLNAFLSSSSYKLLEVRVQRDTQCRTFPTDLFVVWLISCLHVVYVGLSALEKKKTKHSVCGKVKNHPDCRFFLAMKTHSSLRLTF